MNEAKRDEEMNRLYTARELVDLALDGHFCIREVIHEAIVRACQVGGPEARDRLNALPPLKAYATESEIDSWQSSLFLITDKILRPPLQPVVPGQLKLFDER